MLATKFVILWIKLFNYLLCGCIFPDKNVTKRYFLTNYEDILQNILRMRIFIKYLILDFAFIHYFTFHYGRADYNEVINDWNRRLQHISAICIRLCLNCAQEAFQSPSILHPLYALSKPNSHRLLLFVSLDLGLKRFTRRRINKSTFSKKQI
jgi:hypothetical protein